MLQLHLKIPSICKFPHQQWKIVREQSEYLQSLHWELSNPTSWMQSIYLCKSSEKLFGSPGCSSTSTPTDRHSHRNENTSWKQFFFSHWDYTTKLQFKVETIRFRGDAEHSAQLRIAAHSRRKRDGMAQSQVGQKWGDRENCNFLCEERRCDWDLGSSSWCSFRSLSHIFSPLCNSSHIENDTNCQVQKF